MLADPTAGRGGLIRKSHARTILERNAGVAGRAQTLGMSIFTTAIDLPNLPDLPGWADFLIGPGKLILLAVIAALAWLAENQRRRAR